MKRFLLTVLVVFGVSKSAEASVTYTLVDKVFNQDAIDLRASDVYFDITISDAAVQRGNFTVSEFGIFPQISINGDISDFISFHGPQLITPTYVNYGNLRVSMTFSHDDLVSASVQFGGIGNGYTLSGGEDNFGGTFGSDSDHCANFCTVQGRLAVTVPEPATTSVFVLGMFGLLGIIKRKYWMVQKTTY